MTTESVDPKTGEITLKSEAAVGLWGTTDAVQVIQRASAIAGSLRDVLRQQKLTSNIQGKDYVRVEGWTLLGSMLGVFPVCVWSRPTDDGWEARVEARTLAGAVVGAAEASCTRSEDNWGDRDDYALRSMAQTRATSKALRLPLGFVVTMAGFEGTPAEEVPAGGFKVRGEFGVCKLHNAPYFRTKYGLAHKQGDQWCNKPRESVTAGSQAAKMDTEDSYLDADMEADRDAAGAPIQKAAH